MEKFSQALSKHVRGFTLMSLYFYFIFAVLCVRVCVCVWKGVLFWFCCIVRSLFKNCMCCVFVLSCAYFLLVVILSGLYLTSMLEKYFEVEILHEGNQYFCEKCNALRDGLQSVSMALYTSRHQVVLSNNLIFSLSHTHSLPDMHICVSFTLAFKIIEFTVALVACIRLVFSLRILWVIYATSVDAV